MRRITIISLAIILLTSCKKEDISSETTLRPGLASALKAKVTYPLKINFYTTEDTNPAIPPTACSGDLPGFANPGYFIHGHSTLLGLVNPNQSRGQDVTCNLSFTTGLLTTTVAGQLAAADGDLLYYTGSDELNVINLLTNAGPTGTITGVWTITCGTGRFAGATGSFPFSGIVDFATRTFNMNGEGTITY